MEGGAAGRRRGTRKGSAAQPAKEDAAAAAALATKGRAGRQVNGERKARPGTPPCPAKNKALPLEEGKASDQAGKDVPSGRKASQKKQESIPRARGADQVKVKVESKVKAERGCALRENGSSPAKAEVAVRKKEKANPIPGEEQSHSLGKKAACRGRKASQKKKEGAPKGEEHDQAEKGSDPKGKKLASQVKQDCALTAHQRKADDAVAAAQPVPEESDQWDTQNLKQVLQKIKLKKEELSAASQRVNKIRDILVAAIKREPCFRSVEIKGTGSYYEHVKVCTPNEFDIMLKVPDLRVKLEACDTGTSTGAFHYVKLKRNPSSAGLDRFLDKEERLSSSGMLSKLRDIITQEVKNIEDVAIERKRSGSPAVTLIIGNPPSVISVDITIALECRQQNWCDSTNNGLDIKGWLGAKVKQTFLNEPLYLVPKHAKDGRSYKENTWRLSFSNIEKTMITNHGNAKTCCEAKGLRCCRKECLKLLKYLLEQLKTKHQNRNQFDKFNSYHAKTAFFHACTKWPKDDEWPAANLAECFVRLLDYFLDCLRKAELQHFFIPKFNFFSEEIIKAKCNALAKVIENEKRNGFPIFSL